MPGRGVRAVVPVVLATLALSALVVGVRVARPDSRGPDVVARRGDPAVLLDRGHDARRGDAAFTLTGTLAYVDDRRCFVLLGPGRLTLPPISYALRPVVWPANTRGLREDGRVGVQLPTGQQVWAGQNMEVIGTPVLDGGAAVLPASLATCRSDEYVVLERIQRVLPTPVAPDDSGYTRASVPVPDPDQLWTDDSGEALSKDQVAMYTGDGWCNWESITVLSVAFGPVGHTTYGGYIRDPFGILADREGIRFDAHARLPGDARRTGWRQGNVALWLADDAAYLVFDDRTERWPLIAPGAASCA